MKINLLSIGALGVAGLVTTGLMALPLTAQAVEGKDQVIKRDDDTPDVVLVNDDDDDDDDGDGTNTRTRTRSGRDHSRERAQKDFTSDGPGSGNVDHSRNHTNDGTRHNTRG